VVFIAGWKGIRRCSMGWSLESRGLKVTCQKFDPYLNRGPRDMSPFQHGEVFVTDDGAERTSIWPLRAIHPRQLSQSNNVTPGASTSKSSPASGAAIISARPCR